MTVQLNPVAREPKRRGPSASLARGEILVLDGGVGTEVQRRGISLDNCAWSGFCHWQHPELVAEIHRDYIAAGARVITANSFSSSKHILDLVGYGADFEGINRRAVELAVRAREETAARGVWIAGSLSTIPPLDRPERVPTGPEIADNYRRQAAVLADAGADLLIAEMLLDSDSAAILIEATLSAGLPVWAGVSASFATDGRTVNAFRAPGKYLAMGEERLESHLERIMTYDIEVLGVMHSKLPVMDPALRLLRKYWRGPTMAYAETGHSGDHSWFFDDIETPKSYAQHALSWVDKHDVQVVGGCCGTDPGHIAALAQAIEARVATRGS